MRRRMTLVLLGALALAGVAQADRALIVNGQEVPGLTSSLILNTSYVAAEPYARALGARYRFDPGAMTVTFELGGRIAALRLFGSADEAARTDTALSLDGRPQASLGGVLDGGVPYVPVRPLAQVFGGSVASVPERDAVMVMLPRATIREAPAVGRNDGYERIVIEFTAAVPVEHQHVPDGNTVQFRFDRAQLARSHAVQGNAFSGTLDPAGGRAQLTLSLRPNHRYEYFTTPRGNTGFQFVLDIYPAAAGDTAPAAPAAATLQQLVVLDAGLGSSAELEFTRRIARALEARGVRARPNRDGEGALSPSARSSSGIGADLFFSLSVTTAADAPLVVYYLGEASGIDSLQMAVRQNAEVLAATVETDALRRRLLLGLVPDLAAGEEAARAVVRDLEAGGWRAQAHGAPLHPLGGAAGRGLLLELPASELSSERLVNVIADALYASLMRSAGRR